ncbi:hypothetical protein HYFRA_00003296 [Hymenoscyphus fraxineus]|uniref:2EXR domain-containing protein n=1 Tax=Hymenoscyphus fraxineus TaxID=746836 RepID=A0A9N9KVY8_9HELO|nr:hypothetical protein HYFRA_00003296 [Hymenoscyphus fraxineus]
MAPLRRSARHGGHSSSEGPGKVKFSTLPLEIREKIWELTWPESRVVELANEMLGGDNPYDQYGDFIYLPVLRFAGYLQPLLDEKFTSRFPDEDEDYISVSGVKLPNPIALQINHESRVFTLKTYTLFQHTIVPGASIYANPIRDVVWCGDNWNGLWSGDWSPLKDYYNKDLSVFRTAVLGITASLWGRLDIDALPGGNSFPGDRLWNFFKELPGLDRFVIVYSRASSGAPSQDVRNLAMETTIPIAEFLKQKDRAIRFCDKFERTEKRPVKRLLYYHAADGKLEDLLGGQNLKLSEEFNVEMNA